MQRYLGSWNNELIGRPVVRFRLSPPFPPTYRSLFQDRVLVEAAYNPNMPFKWNATRIQVLPNQRAGGPGGGGAGGAPPVSSAAAGQVNPTATPNQG